MTDRERFDELCRKKDWNLDDLHEALELVFNGDESMQPDESSIDHVEMNSFDDIVYYKDGTSKIVYHCCD